MPKLQDNELLLLRELDLLTWLSSKENSLCLFEFLALLRYLQLSSGLKSSLGANELFSNKNGDLYCSMNFLV